MITLGNIAYVGGPVAPAPLRHVYASATAAICDIAAPFVANRQDRAPPGGSQTSG